MVRRYCGNAVFKCFCSVLCFAKAIKFIMKCFNHVIIILLKNTAFDTVNAGRENVALIFLIGAVEYEMTCFFCF